MMAYQAGPVLATVGAVEEIAFSETVKGVIDLGVAVMLVLIFVFYFIHKALSDDKRVNRAYDEAQKKIADCDRQIRERENYLLSESAKREEIIRQESEKRENLIRKEAEKRESILMANQDRMVDSMREITVSLSKIEMSLNKMESRHETDIRQIKAQMETMEGKIDRIDQKGDR
ncbi:MAG: hypothetical protein NC305_13390 [Lachnospiraceae bacterium]|nr:hypothetical protein [Butyrivibrio sp.]MCM1344008.1 hypothetical protein [Muribaculaceae bacterium]MCM1411525.1 hypothetical protein [Lachnospiraceae bacterium]